MIICPYFLFSQTEVSTADYDIYIKDTLLLDVSQMEFLPRMDIAIQKTLQFKPKTDGVRTYYYIDGWKNCVGLTLNKKRTGEWTSWYDSGQTSSKILYTNGSKEGKCTYWYKSGALNATGQYKNDLKEGEWLFYNPDNSFKGKYIYEKGVLIKVDQ